MASKRRNMFHKNKTQETAEKGVPKIISLRLTLPGAVDNSHEVYPVESEGSKKLFYVKPKVGDIVSGRDQGVVKLNGRTRLTPEHERHMKTCGLVNIDSPSFPPGMEVVIKGFRFGMGRYDADVIGKCRPMCCQTQKSDIRKKTVLLSTPKEAW
ncbi:hypothetical protein AAG570_012311 [Ranatra chinensis]|uniref:Uncharacterized protein n=1 Tax=Ranatra chinensis TaxID=642074 RepID=A0ABD0YKJ7_9HEMI